MAATSNYSISPSDGWQLIATDPDAVTVKSNDPATVTAFVFQLAITAANSEPTVDGEKHAPGVSWVSGGFTGYLWIRVLSMVSDRDFDFAVTVE